MNNIESLVDLYIAKKREETKKTQNTWYLSSLGGCLSGVYYSRLKGQKEYPPQKLRVFQAGNIYEDFVAKCMIEGNKKTKYFLQEHVENKELNVSGRIDVLAKTKDKYIIYELKTINERGFFYNDLPYHHHVMQVLGYKHFMFGNNDNVETKLVYISKDTFLLKEMVIPYQPKIITEIEQSLMILNEAWKNKKPPKEEPGVIFDEKRKRWTVNWKAKFCAYHEMCSKDDNWLNKATVKAKELNNR